MSDTQELIVLRERIRQLEHEKAFLEERLVALHEEVSFLRTHKTLRAGMAGETVVARAVRGAITSYAGAHDVQVGNIRLEVKYSGINRTGSRNRSHGRWAWGKIFGEEGNKDYEYLVLVGEKDEAHRTHYRDLTSPYVFFCIPREDVESLTQSMNGGRYRAIQLNSNPQAARRSRARYLFANYQHSYEELEEKFLLESRM